MYQSALYTIVPLGHNIATFKLPYPGTKDCPRAYPRCRLTAATKQLHQHNSRPPRQLPLRHKRLRRRHPPRPAC